MVGEQRVRSRRISEEDPGQTCRPPGSRTASEGEETREAAEHEAAERGADEAEKNSAAAARYETSGTVAT